MLRDITNDIVRQRREEQERIIKQAFQKHFHFPFEEVEDMSSFERIIRSNSTVQEFRYKGEGFLLWDESEGLNVETGINYWRGTLTAKYLMI